MELIQNEYGTYGNLASYLMDPDLYDEDEETLLPLLGPEEITQPMEPLLNWNEWPDHDIHEEKDEIPYHLFFTAPLVSETPLKQRCLLFSHTIKYTFVQALRIATYIAERWTLLCNQRECYDHFRHLRENDMHIAMCPQIWRHIPLLSLNDVLDMAVIKFHFHVQK